MFLKLLNILAVLPVFTLAWFHERDAPDRWSTGEIWPLPQTVAYGELNRTIDPTKIGFDLLDKKTCDVLTINAEIYLNKWLFPFPVSVKGSADKFVVKVKVRQQCPKGTPKHLESEEYSVRVSTKKATIIAETVWGALRGMETLSQLIFFNEKSSQDIMAMNKMNVLHWHLVDSEAFPYESKKFPELHRKGAYSPRHVYSRADVADIISYARLRGIRVMPEFDMPGHAASWSGRDGFVADCLNKDGKWTWPDLMDVSEEKNFKFIDEFLNEVADTFPDEFLHLGGDEVADFIGDCWDRNAKIQRFMLNRGFANNTELQNYFFDRLAKIVNYLKNKRRMVFWQEVSDNNKPVEFILKFEESKLNVSKLKINLDPNAIIHIWKGDTHQEIYDQVKNITAKGHQVILSACWYLNYIKYGADWREARTKYPPSNSRYYYCDPANFTAPEEQKKLVLGGIVAMWGEFVDNTNTEDTLWPRASAAAERLWSAPDATKDSADAWPRMHELRCRLLARGFRIQPNINPDYCPFEFDEKYEMNCVCGINQYVNKKHYQDFHYAK